MKRLIAILVVTALLGFGTSRALDWWNFNVNTPVSTNSHSVAFHMDLGETPSQVGSALYTLSLIRSTIAFDLYTRVTNTATKFQAGNFVLNKSMSMAQIVDALQHGKSDQKVITFPEGFPLREQAKIVETKKIATAAEYLAAAKDPTWQAPYTFLPKVAGNPDAPFEGYLFPDTYLIDPAAGVSGLVKEQLDQFAVVFHAHPGAQLAPSN